VWRVGRESRRGLRSPRLTQHEERVGERRRDECQGLLHEGGTREVRRGVEVDRLAQTEYWQVRWRESARSVASSVWMVGMRRVPREVVNREGESRKVFAAGVDLSLPQLP
jgi:hypothetical protein